MPISLRRRLTTLVLFLLLLTPGLPAQPAVSGEPENLGEAINSQYNEVAPVIGPDGRTLYFHRFNHPGNVGGVEGGEDIWFSSIGRGGQWTAARNIGPPLNNASNNFVTSVSPDDNTLLVGNIYEPDGGMRAGVSISHRTRNGWSLPQRLVIEGFFNASKQGFFSLSADGRALVIEVVGLDTYGEDDLYVSFIRPDGTWSRPLNLGPTINTAGKEITPFLAADGRTLYFSSDTHPGIGDQDVFVTRRLDDTWTNWSAPVNITSVNTEGWDAYFTLPAAGDYAYVVSYTNSYGGSDIFRVKLPQAVRPLPVAVVTGRVLDAVTGEPLGARVAWNLSGHDSTLGNARSDTTTGHYTAILAVGGRFRLRAAANGYRSIEREIDLSQTSRYAEIEQDLYLTPERPPTTLVLDDILFEFAKATLRPEARSELERLALVVGAYPELDLLIAGHTDDVGEEESNQRLSLDRAEAVAAFLAGRGITRNRMTVIGHGELRPRGTNETDEGRQRNRRVEVELRARNE